MDATTRHEILTQDIQVQPRISEINDTIQRLKGVSILAIHPMFKEMNGHRELQAFRIRVEGLSKRLRELSRILEEAHLTYKP